MIMNYFIGPWKTFCDRIPLLLGNNYYEICTMCICTFTKIVRVLGYWLVQAECLAM